MLVEVDKQLRDCPQHADGAEEAEGQIPHLELLIEFKCWPRFHDSLASENCHQVYSNYGLQQEGSVHSCEVTI